MISKKKMVIFTAKFWCLSVHNSRTTRELCITNSESENNLSICWKNEKKRCFTAGVCRNFWIHTPVETCSRQCSQQKLESPCWLPYIITNIINKNWVPTSQWTVTAFTTKTNLLMLFRETISVQHENNWRHISTVRGHSHELCSSKWYMENYLAVKG
jgi:hypothetical protein